MVPSSSASPTALDEVGETMARIRTHKGVEGVMVMTKQGMYLKPSYNLLFTTQFFGILITITKADV